MSAGLLLPYHHRWPKVAPNAFVAAGSSVIGDVVLGAQSSVWFNCVLRGDVNYIRASAARSNVAGRPEVQDDGLASTPPSTAAPRNASADSTA